MSSIMKCVYTRYQIPFVMDYDCVPFHRCMPDAKQYLVNLFNVWDAFMLCRPLSGKI